MRTASSGSNNPENRPPWRQCGLNQVGVVREAEGLVLRWFRDPARRCHLQNDVRIPLGHPQHEADGQGRPFLDRRRRIFEEIEAAKMEPTRTAVAPIGVEGWLPKAFQKSPSQRRGYDKDCNHVAPAWLNQRAEVRIRRSRQGGQPRMPNPRAMPTTLPRTATPTPRLTRAPFGSEPVKTARTQRRPPRRGKSAGGVAPEIA